MRKREVEEVEDEGSITDSKGRKEQLELNRSSSSFFCYPPARLLCPSLSVRAGGPQGETRRDKETRDSRCHTKLQMKQLAFSKIEQR